jgi:hypothetical protein
LSGVLVRVPTTAGLRYAARRRQILAALACQCGNPERHTYRAVATRLRIDVSTVVRHAGR